MIEITELIRLDESEIDEEFIRNAGPGGQNVNKVETAVQLRFDAARSPNLDDAARARLLKLAGKRATAEGEVLIVARAGRTQAENREAALRQLIDLVRRAATPPRPRRKTAPSAAARARRLEGKRRRSEVKRSRQKPPSALK